MSRIVRFVLLFSLLASVFGCVQEEKKPVKKGATSKPKPYMIPFKNGMSAFEEQNYKGAMREFSEAIKKGPDFHKAWYRRGLCRLELKQDSLAASDFSKTLEIKPDMVDAWYQRGLAHLNQRKFDAAIQDLSQAEALSPGYKDGMAWKGVARIKAGQAEQGCADLKMARSDGDSIAEAFIIAYCQ